MLFGLDRRVRAWCARLAYSPSLQRLLPAEEMLQIEESRRADSNRGPLHYELSASSSGGSVICSKCGGRRQKTSPSKSKELQSAPAMCSTGVPIAAIPDAAVSKIARGRRSLGGSNPSPSAQQSEAPG
jgi:hypothetical protein